jgi:formylglycine-generating enzyme required for sulfatase activity
MRRCYSTILQCGAVAGVVFCAVAALGSTSIQTVQVGAPGNNPDGDGYGSVSYTFNIGKFDVTAAQYTSFLNAVAATDNYGLYDSAMAGTTGGDPGIMQNGIVGAYSYAVISGRDNRPATDVTFWDTLRFANWLANGQPTGSEGVGTTETGSYTLASIATESGLLTVNRNAGATWALASEDEWYKAAYYSPALGTGAGGYWHYATQTNDISSSQANYQVSGLGDTTNVGSYSYPSFFGTYDQSGDAYQWNEPLLPSPFASIQGGSFDNSDFFLAANGEYDHDPDQFESWLGFRVVQVPESSSSGLMFLIAVATLSRRCAPRGGTSLS